MHIDYSYSDKWPQEIKDIEAKRYRLQMKIVCLESNIERCDFESFDTLMQELEQAQQELMQLSMQKSKLIYEHMNIDTQ